MWRPYQILWPLFSLFIVRVDLTDLSPMTFSVQILKVYDGDTVLVRKGSFEHKVRLSRIDAPEKGQPYLTGSGDAGKMAGECLKKNLSKHAVLRVGGQDIYGRILGDLDDVSLRLVQQGCVAIYPHAHFNSLKEKYIYLGDYFKARRLRKGIWAFGGFMQPKAWRKKNKRKFKTRI